MFDKFIKATNEYTTKEKSIPAPYIRKTFTLEFTPEKANVKICTPGLYELYLNGENITKGFLAPYISNPDHICCYDEYDVTELLKKGKNAIGVILGNGFANQTTNQWNYSKAPFRAPLCVALTFEASDKEHEFTLTADESFKTHPSAVIYDMYRYGTHYDARLEIDGWCSPEFDDKDWKCALIADKPNGEITLCTAHPIVIKEEIHPISIQEQSDFCYLKTALYDGDNCEFTHIDNGYLYDFGTACAGVCKLRIKGNRGQKITVRHGEKLADDGKFNINSIYTFNDNYREYIHLFQTDVYVLRGGEEEIYIPKFTYHGFRYAFVEGILPNQAKESLLTYEVLSSDIKARAKFNCSNKDLNTLYAMAINADISNFHYFPTDCPHREKNGWMGDIAASAEQLLLSFDATESFKLWMKSVHHAQRKSGMLPGIVPTSDWGYDWGNGPFWDSACVYIPYFIYKYDGRIDVFSENADVIFKYLQYISGRRNSSGLIACGLGDWCQPGTPKEKIKAPLELTDSVTVYDIARKSAYLYECLGLTEEMNFANKLAEELRCAIRKELIDFETMAAKGYCQTSQAYLLATDIFLRDEYKKAYIVLLNIIDENGKKLDTGVIGLRYIFDILIRGGDIELALKLILNEDAPSYKAMINRGATALCESLIENGMNESENHHFFGDIIRIFINYIAGLKINPNTNDKNEFIFSPVIPESVNYANAEYQGIKVGWKRESEKIFAYAEVPEGFNGKFIFGTISKKLKSGKNEFIV